MKKKSLTTFVVMAISITLFSQTTSENKPTIIEGTFLGISQLPKAQVVYNALNKNYVEIKNFSSRYDKNLIVRNLHPKVDVLWDAEVKNKNPRGKETFSRILSNFEGMGFSQVNPPDPTIASGNDHVVQMINGRNGAMLQIFDKSGLPLTNAVEFDGLFKDGYGLGDPIVLYDQLANRWLLSEFSKTNNELFIAISITSDPTLDYYTYKFEAVNFPDYPKYAIWPDAYYCTTNENTSAIYAFERDSMLVGAQARVIRQSVGGLSGFSFQTLTPVSFEGTDIPSTLPPASFWRHVDDEAHYPSIANPISDYIEYWEFTPDFEQVENSIFRSSTQVSVSDFDTDIDGFNSLTGITQPFTSVTLDPLREVLMNRMSYRNFGDHQSIVACHVTDVDGNDRAGIRWYELRKTPNSNWSLFQEGTYSPSVDNRWMGAIDINKNGTICLAYSVSSSTVFPSLRYTARGVNDALGTMTLPEKTIVNGRASNQSSRYGDYASMSIDPTNDLTFWFTGEYNETPLWSVRMAHIEVGVEESDFEWDDLIKYTFTTKPISCHNGHDGSIEIIGSGGTKLPLSYSLDGDTWSPSGIFDYLDPGTYAIYISDANQNITISDSIEIENPTPLNISYTLHQQPSKYAIGNKIEVHASGGTGPYQYSLDGITYSKDSVITDIKEILFSVSIKDNNKCLHTQEIDLTVTDIPNNLTQSNNILIYPNPNDGRFSVSLGDQFVHQDMVIVITDIVGRKLESKFISKNASQSIIYFDISAFSSGMYLITIRNGSQYFSKQLIKY